MNEIFIDRVHWRNCPRYRYLRAIFFRIVGCVLLGIVVEAISITFMVLFDTGFNMGVIRWIHMPVLFCMHIFDMDAIYIDYIAAFAQALLYSAFIYAIKKPLPH